MRKQSHFIEVILRRGCSTVTLLHFFRTVFPKTTSGGLLLSDPGQKNRYYSKFYVVLSKKYLRNIGLARIKDHD